jgi:hypothetical protein
VADTTIAGLPTKAAPLDYLIPKSIEVLPRSIQATFDGTGAGAAFLPTLQVIADSGVVVGTYPVDTAVAAGASATASWFPGVTKAAASAAASSVIGAQVTRTADLTVGAGAGLTIAWDTLIGDTSGGTVWTAGAPTQMFAPSAGTYLATVNADYYHAAVGFPLFSTFTGAASLSLGQYRQADDGVTGRVSALSTAGVAVLAAGDYVSFRVNNGGGQAVEIADTLLPEIFFVMTFTRLG